MSRINISISKSAAVTHDLSHISTRSLHVSIIDQCIFKRAYQATELS